MTDIDAPNLRDGECCKTCKHAMHITTRCEICTIHGPDAEHKGTTEIYWICDDWQPQAAQVSRRTMP